MEFYKPEKPRLFPEWVKDPKYLPTMEDLKALRQQGLWDDFIHHNPNGNEFQILTKEFVDSLSKYLSAEISSLPKESVSVLEVGAGNGRLTYFLKEALEQEIKDKQIIFKAVDDFSWDDKMGASLGAPYRIKKIFDVEQLSAAEALNTEPDIVISSWMPKDEDWTSLFKKNKKLHSFILVGKEDDCGTEKSWQPDDEFERNDIDVEGSVCWSDIFPGLEHSKAAAFLRRSDN